MTLRTLVSALMLTAAVSFAAQPAVASDPQKHGKGHAKGHSKPQKAGKHDRDNVRGTSGRDAVVFDRDGHARVLRDYWGREGLPPGLAKRDSLPPGLRRQLRERGTLPPGLQRQLSPVPDGLGRLFPRVPEHYTRYLADRDLVVVDTRTNRIVTIIPGRR